MARWSPSSWSSRGGKFVARKSVIAHNRVYRSDVFRVSHSMHEENGRKVAPEQVRLCSRRDRLPKRIRLRAYFSAAHIRTRASAPAHVHGSWIARTARLQYTDNSVIFVLWPPIDYRSMINVINVINVVSLSLRVAEKIVYVFFIFFLIFLLTFPRPTVSLWSMIRDGLLCNGMLCATILIWRWIRSSVCGLVAQIFVIAGADWNKRGCINLHARSHYSRIALHNVTILQGVTLNSFDEDNDVVPQRAVVRWINFFVQSFFFQILTSSLSLSFSLSLSPSKCNSFLYFFFWFRLRTKILVFVESLEK